MASSSTTSAAGAIPGVSTTAGTNKEERFDRAPRLISSGGRRDLAVRLLWRGVKSRFKSSVGPASGGSLQSAAWGTSHDGGVLEIERVEWLPVSFAFPLLYLRFCIF